MVRESGQPIIEIRGLTKTFKDFWMRPRVTAIDALDMDVRGNEVFGLLGPNGSGKSTTIKVILGLLFPTKGRVSVFGKLPTDVSTKREIGYLPEESYLYRFLNARETLDYYGRLFHLDRATRKKRIDMLLEMVGLEAVQRRPVGEYSKGMQRRIGLAQALINDPRLLILDEPTTGLDPIGTRQIKDLILQLRDKGTTVLLSSHLLADVEDVCDRVTVLYGGKIRAEGTVGDLLTVGDKTLIETDHLQPETIAKIEHLLETEEGKSILKVEAPRQKLEGLFLDIVEKAQAEGVATSGARSGGNVAEFLTREAHLPQQADGQALIDELVSTDDKQPQKQSTPTPATPAPTQEEETVINELTQTKPDPNPTNPTNPTSPQKPSSTTPSQPKPHSTDKPKPAEDVDQNIIDDLLGGDKPS